VRIRVEQGDRCAGRWSGLLDEVAGAGAEVEMSASEMHSISLDHRRDGTAPDRTSHEAEHERVVDREEEGVVAGLALVRGIVAIHLALGALRREDPMTAEQVDSTRWRRAGASEKASGAELLPRLQRNRGGLQEQRSATSRIPSCQGPCVLPFCAEDCSTTSGVRSSRDVPAPRMVVWKTASVSWRLPPGPPPAHGPQSGYGRHR